MNPRILIPLASIALLASPSAWSRPLPGSRSNVLDFQSENAYGAICAAGKACAVGDGASPFGGYFKVNVMRFGQLWYHVNADGRRFHVNEDWPGDDLAGIYAKADGQVVFRVDDARTGAVGEIPLGRLRDPDALDLTRPFAATVDLRPEISLREGVGVIVAPDHRYACFALQDGSVLRGHQNLLTKPLTIRIADPIPVRLDLKEYDHNIMLATWPTEEERRNCEYLPFGW